MRYSYIVFVGVAPLCAQANRSTADVTPGAGTSPSHGNSVPPQPAGKSVTLSPTKGIQTSSSLVDASTDASSIELLSPALKIPEGLDTMRHIIFLDVDNYRLWEQLPQRLPDRTFVWGFYGSDRNWKDPFNEPFQYAKQNGLWHVHKCSDRKDAADFAICLMVGKLDERLPEHIPFTIVSGDKGFLELEEHMRCSRRRVTVVGPHLCPEDEVYALICNIGES